MRTFSLWSIALATSIALAVLGAELLLRVANPFVSRIQNDRIVLPAGELRQFDVGFRGLDARVEYRTNSLGFRGPEPPPAGAAGTRVIFVGGSTTEMRYQQEPKTWTHLAGDRLAAVSPGLWWNNAGLDGHSTFGHRVLLSDYLKDLRPDMVVFLVGTNDVGHDAPKSFDREAARTGLDFRTPGGFLKSLAAYSEVVAAGLQVYRWDRARRLGLPHEDLDIAAAPIRPLDAPAAEALLDRHRARFLPGYRGRLLALVAGTRAFGGIPVLVTQPLVYGPVIDDRTGVDLATVGADLYEPGIDGLTAWRLLELYNDVTREVAMQEGIPLIDAARALPKSSRLFYDETHFTNEGSAELAAIVSKGLCPVISRSC